MEGNDESLYCHGNLIIPLIKIVLENQPATRKKSDVQGFMNDSGPKLSPEHDRLSWTGVRFGQLSLIGANWTLISVFPNSLIF